MKRSFKRLVSGLLAGVLAAALPVTACFGSAEAEDTVYYPDTMIQANLPDEQPTAAQDFYLSVNYDYIKNFVMPEGRSLYASFSEVDDAVREDMTALLGGTEGSGEKLDLARAAYGAYLDTDARNAAGWSSVTPYVEAIENADTAAELLAVLDAGDTCWDWMGYFGISVAADEKDSGTNVISLQAPSLYLEDPAEYSAMTELGELYRSADDVFFTSLLEKYGYSADEAAAMLADQFTWETMLAEHIYPAEVSYREDYAQLTYNPYTADELAALAGDFPITEILQRYGVGGQEKYIVTEPDYIASLASLVTDENLPLMKAAAVISLLAQASRYTDEEAYGYYNDWVNTENGSTGMQAAETRAYNFLCTLLPELTGDIYAENYFSEEEKADVEELFLQIRAALRARLEQADWLSEETRDIALEKLDSLGYYIAYAEEDFFDYSMMTVRDTDDLFTTVVSISDRISAQLCAAAGGAVNREAWGTIAPANEVNAYYEPTTNSVYFPAAILQAPFYDADYSTEQNYGAIGAIMGHEITHAFDSNTGSLYDKDGNLTDWWTDEDRAAFTARTSAVGERYASYATVGDMHVNGDLTIGETVADLGGMAAALDALAQVCGDDADYAAFFTQYAAIWRCVLTAERAAERLRTDEHAPGCLRVNVTAAQFEQFYEAFNIQPGDPMYTAPEDRLSVW